MSRVETATLLEDGSISVAVTTPGLKPPRGAGAYKIQPNDKTYEQFKKRFNLENVGDTNTIQLTFEDKVWKVT